MKIPEKSSGANAVQDLNKQSKEREDMETIQDQVFNQRLGILALMQGNRETIDAFYDGYKTLMEDLYTDMKHVRRDNLEKIRTGGYAAQGELMKALLQKQIDYLQELAKQESDEE